MPRLEIMKLGYRDFPHRHSLIKSDPYSLTTKKIKGIILCWCFKHILNYTATQFSVSAEGNAVFVLCLLHKIHHFFTGIKTSQSKEQRTVYVDSPLA